MGIARLSQTAKGVLSLDLVHLLGVAQADARLRALCQRRPLLSRL